MDNTRFLCAISPREFSCWRVTVWKWVSKMKALTEGRRLFARALWKALVSLVVPSLVILTLYSGPL